MSPKNSKTNTTSSKDNTTSALRDHIRAFEYAKMERIVHANADTPAGAGIRRRSSLQADRSADRSSDLTPLVSKKPHWTTEERWEGKEGESQEIWERRMTMAAAEDGELHGGDGAAEAGGRKKSLGSKISGLAVKTFTGYVGKKDEFGRYAI